MRCDYEDPRTGATHTEIIDSLRFEMGHMRRKLLAASRRLSAITAVIDAVDGRCAAADGPVTPTKDEITGHELKRIYRLAIKSL